MESGAFIIPILRFLTDFANLFKIGFILFSLVYFIFSLIVIRQVNLMSQTLITEGDGVLKVAALIHALIALGVVIFFLILL